MVRGVGESRESIDQTKVLIPLRDRLTPTAFNAREGYELALRLLDSYLTFAEYKTLVNSASSKLKNFKNTKEPGWFGSLRTASFMYERKSTGRYYTNNDNIQNWNLNMVSSITCPKDYILFWCDFEQIDLRVAYGTMLRESGTKNDKIYQEETDKYRAIYRIMCEAEGVPPDLELFKEYRKSYKKAVLSAVYNATEASLAHDIHNKELAARLKHYVDNNPGYAEFRNVLNRVLEYGVEIPVVDYFGVQGTLPIPSNGDHWARNTVVSQACNKPVQTTSNSILVLWLEALLTRFESYGFSRKTHVIPYLIRHDECIFMLHKDVIKEHFWVFADYMKIAIDDWDLLELEPQAGLHYDEPLQDFLDMYNAQVEKHKNELTPRLVTKPREQTYRPITDVIDLYTYTMNTPCEYAALCGATGEQLTDTDKALDLITQLANTENSPYRTTCTQYLAYAGKWIIYSSKYNMFKCIPDLSVAIDLCHRINGKFMNIYNVTKYGQLIFEDIYIKIDSTNSSMVLDLMGKMERENFSTSFVKLI
ncbi:MAG: DNA polymerase [Acinetobacter sp.]